MKIGIPVKCQNGHTAVWIVEISGLEHHHKGVPEADKCKCPKHDFGMGYSAYDKPFVIGDDVVEALRKDAERYRWLVLHAEEIYVEPPGSIGVNIYVDSFQAKRDSSIKESMDVEIDGLMAKASTP